ncbi:hypothetical protein Afil01_35080 [Actinorhabdospora filicis]|uniref:Uncharacterized protein n=1 Tax=Actinorhabdospora filicis TaxID=1785913 RepID=A0A9W6SQ49_9ACTN|nr:hypothetical protein Afil01_35080 [Actinorhabdospora filicis]
MQHHAGAAGAHEGDLGQDAGQGVEDDSGAVAVVVGAAEEVHEHQDHDQRLHEQADDLAG